MLIIEKNLARHLWCRLEAFHCIVVVNFVRRGHKLLKKSILLEGMINLTGKGVRLGVVKATDADTGKSIGRIQARRADEVNKGGFYLLDYALFN